MGGRGLLRAEDARWAARAVVTRGESLLQLLQGQRRLGGVYDHPRRPLRRHRQLASLWPLTEGMKIASIRSRAAATCKRTPSGRVGHCQHLVLECQRACGTCDSAGPCTRGIIESVHVDFDFPICISGIEANEHQDRLQTEPKSSNAHTMQTSKGSFAQA